MKSSEVSQKFLDFFKAREHRIQPSASLVPADPTMLLTGAGMVPFKPIFMGKIQVDYTRAASVQKCVRTTDIEMIGITGRHLSFFEMLGNFSFGDYYKSEAITWAWEFITEWLNLDRERLWVTVFETDDEAAGIWRDAVGVAPERIVRLGEKENFWSAGPTGPCGPCSEIHFDQGPEFGCAKPDCAPGCDCDRYLEIWNLVFMQYNRDETGELHTLPKKNIDTGMGLERITSVLQGVRSNYETDLLLPIIQAVCEAGSVKYGADPKTDTSLKIIADHARAITFMIGDGILPGNDGRGYILRRLIRRAVRHGRLIGIEKDFLAPLISVIAEIMGGRYPEISENLTFIQKIVTREEERFGNTLRQGLTILGSTVKEIKASGGRSISGKAAFKLYDTYGFPFELTQEIAAESGLEIDGPGFDVLMEEQRIRARSNSGGAHAELYVGNIYHQIQEQIGRTDFLGYELYEAQGIITAIAAGEEIKMDASKDDKVELFLDRTPFYAEKGGQVGDRGIIVTETGKVRIADTVAPIADLIVHRGVVIEGEVKIGQAAEATIDLRRRLEIARNHTATHLLHWALRTVLGQHVKQAGSLVEAQRLRFDFNHLEPLTDEQLANIEKIVNEKILAGMPVRAFETTQDYAKEAGALAFFGEKYGHFVRLVEIGDFSKELCGGVHVNNSSQVGFIKIIGETGIGANTRRLEAITGERFLDYVNRLGEAMKAVSKVLKAVPGTEVQAAESLAANRDQLEKELSRLLEEKMSREAERIATEAEQLDGVSFFAGRLMGADAEALRVLADRLRSITDKAIAVLVSNNNGKALLLVAATPALVGDGFSAGLLVKKVAPLIGGSGGGRADMAQAGGKDVTRLAEVLVEAKNFIVEFVKAEK